MTERRRWTIEELRGELASLGAEAELADLADRLASLRREAAAPGSLESLWTEISKRTADLSRDQSEPGDDVEGSSGSSAENASGK